jgi:hypothetical protein
MVDAICRFCGTQFTPRDHRRYCNECHYAPPAVYRFSCPDGRSFVGSTSDLKARSLKGLSRTNRRIKTAIEKYPQSRLQIEACRRAARTAEQDEVSAPPKVATPDQSAESPKAQYAAEEDAAPPTDVLASGMALVESAIDLALKARSDAGRRAEFFANLRSYIDTVEAFGAPGDRPDCCRHHEYL